MFGGIDAVKRCYQQAVKHKETRLKRLLEAGSEQHSAEGGTRTLMRLPSTVFETVASTIPPPRLVLYGIAERVGSQAPVRPALKKNLPRLASFLPYQLYHREPGCLPTRQSWLTHGKLANRPILLIALLDQFVGAQVQ